MNVDLSGHYGYGRILRTMIPSVVMVVVASVYSIVDGFFVSNLVGATPFAAINLIWPVIMLVGGVGMMIGSGGSALVSKILGQKRPQRANEVFSMLIKAGAMTGLLLSVVCILLLPMIIRSLGAVGELADQCYTYGLILLLGLPFYILQTAFWSLLMAAEKPSLGTWMTIASGAMNIVLDALLIIVFGWGLAGAAVATVAGMALGALYPMWYFSREREGACLRLTKCRLERRPLLKACSNGLSEYVTNVALSIVGICYNIQLMNYIGEGGIVAYGIVMYVAYVFAAVFIGYNIFITPVAGFNYGAQDHTELKSLLRKSLVIVFALGTVMTLFSELAADWAASVFVGYDRELTELTAHAFRLYMLSFLIYGFNQFVSAWFTALGNGVISAICSFTHTLVFEILCIFTFPLFLGLDGIWLAVDFADVLTLAVTITFLLRYRRRYGY